MNRVLIIEANKALCNKLTETIKSGGFKVVCYENSAEYFNSSDLVYPDLVLCNTSLNGLNGFEIKNNLNEDERTENIPFIFYSESTNVSLIRRGMLLGADDFIFLPVNDDDLLNSIYLRLKKYRKILFQLDEKSVPKVQLSRGRKIYNIPYEEIVHVDALGDYTTVYTVHYGRFIQRKTLKSWMSELPNSEFFKIHKSYIVNIDYIESITFDDTQYWLKVKNEDHELPISTRQVSKLKTVLGS